MVVLRLLFCIVLKPGQLVLTYMYCSDMDMAESQIR